MAQALLDLIDDEPGRRGMAAAALESARMYDPEPIAERYERLFEELASSRFARRWERTRVRLRASYRRKVRRWKRAFRRRLPAAGGKSAKA